jgi:hypothetical protein
MGFRNINLEGGNDPTIALGKGKKPGDKKG